MIQAAWPEGTDELLDEILTDAHGEDEQLWALRQAFENDLSVPADAFVIDEPVEVLEIDYEGNTRRGLVARCRRDDGSEHVTTAADVLFPAGSEGARLMAAYRKWLGLEPAGHHGSTANRRQKRHKTAPGDLDLTAPVELIVLAPKTSAVRCRVLGTERELTLRSSRAWDMVPGEIVTVRARKQWRYAGHPYLSGDVESYRLDVMELGLQPLRLRDEWEWDPEQEYWGEKDEPLEECIQRIISHGPRSSFAMEQVRPGTDPNDWDSDPILAAIERNASGDLPGAELLLVEMLATDLRCLDAHAHLGNFAFEADPKRAARHFEVGTRIGELSLGERFDGVLPWGRIDNRPFLCCLHGYGLCLWRLGRVKEAAAVFERTLWLNPSDNQGIRFLLPEVNTGKRWEEHRDGN